jgi:hypothetical protein
MSARVVRLHSRLLNRAAERREAAARHRMAGDTERAEIAQDDAAEALADANALRDMLAEHPDIYIPDPRHMALMADGETH